MSRRLGSADCLARSESSLSRPRRSRRRYAVPPPGRELPVAMVHITELNIYPVKGCRGIALNQARVTAAGFEHDREWLIVNAEGRFITQRERPQLARIETALTPDALILRKPNGADLSVPLDMTERAVEVTCWRDRCAA